MLMLRASAAKQFPDVDATGSTDATAGSTNAKGTMGSRGGLAIAQQGQGQDMYHASPRASHGPAFAATATLSCFRGPKKLGGQRPNSFNPSLQLSSGSSVNRNRTVGGQPRGGSAATVPVANPPSERRLTGHYVKTPSERMLSELADSLADISRKPSFARIQSMQVRACGVIESYFVSSEIKTLMV